MKTIAFDTDDTLIIPSIVTGMPYDTPNYDTIALFKWFQAQGNDMVIWSGGGVDYAKMWADKLGLVARILPKEKNDSVDLCFDDMVVDLAKINLRVKRINNSIKRKENTSKRININN